MVEVHGVSNDEYLNGDGAFVPYPWLGLRTPRPTGHRVTREEAEHEAWLRLQADLRDWDRLNGDFESDFDDFDAGYVSMAPKSQSWFSRLRSLFQ